MLVEQNGSNRILAALSPESRQVLMAQAERVELRQGQSFDRRLKSVAGAYFPLSGILSVQMLLRQGGTVEVGLVGRESLLVVHEADRISSNQLSVRRSGAALRVPFEILFAQCRCDPLLERIVQARWVAIVGSVSQIAACNRHHRIDQQLSRWILDYLDHDDLNEITESQEWIASALGVRREGVTEALGRLQKRGMISVARRSLQVLDRLRLEAASCECYRIIRDLRRIDLPAPQFV